MEKLHCVRVDSKIKPVAGTEFELDADLVLLAMGFVHPVHEGMIKALGLELDQRGNVKADTLAYRGLEPEGVRGRRHAPRPVAGGVGNPRRPPVRPLGRQVSDGIDHAAALIRGNGPGKLSGKCLEIENGRRGASVTHPLLLRLLGIARGLRVGHAALRGCGTRLAPLFGCPPDAAGAADDGGVGCSATGSAIGALPRDQAKSSARPIGR